MRHTVDEIRNAFAYDPGTGILRWKIKKGNRFPGMEAGSVKDGRVVVRLDRRGYGVSILAWVITYGEWPDRLVDHRDRNSLNNALSNLRLATYAQNVHNREKLPRNSTGLKGAFFNKQIKKYVSEIRHNGERTFLGTFETAQAAHEAYCRAANELHGEFACHD